jgi:uncharacterized membrane protein
MTSAPMLAAPAAFQVHTGLALIAALMAGAALAKRKGTASLKALGRAWVALMAIVAIISFAIATLNPSGGFSAVHLLSMFTLVMLVVAVRAAQPRDIPCHRGAMPVLAIGALSLAGAFTLAPGRLMNAVIFGG